MQDQKANIIDNSYLDALSSDQVFRIKVHHQSEEDSWMRHFESRQMLDQLYEGQNRVSLVLEGISAKFLSGSEQPPQISSTAERGRNPSIFHNHQKNLVSLLKRLINVDRKDLNKLPHGLEAFNLWKWFVDEGLKCKKALFIVFGTNVSKNQKFLKEVALQSPKLHKWLRNIKEGSVEESQRLLRELVHRKALEAERKTVQQISKVKDFPSFYSYFLIFVEELSGGALPLRMPKEQKTKHMTQEK